MGKNLLDTNKRRKLLAVEVRDFKRCQFARIDFTTAVTLIGGGNSQGKSSAIDGISSLLGGERLLCADPVRDGAEEATLWGDLGDCTVERTIDHEGTKLVVRDADGNKVDAPQTQLSAMFTALNFDPSGFDRMEPKDQDAILKKLGNVDLTEVLARRKAAYDERTRVHQRAEELDVKFRERKHNAAAPDSEVSVDELTAKLEEHETWEAEHDDLVEALEAETAKVTKAQARLASAEQELEYARKGCDAALESRKPTQEKFDTHRERPAPSRADVMRELKASGETNRLVRSNRERQELGMELRDAQARAKYLKSTIEACDAEKDKMIAAAKFPIAGLGFDELGPTYRGHPLSQAGDADRWKISAAIALAMNPTLPLLLIRRGSLLDEASLLELQQVAEQREPPAQIVIELVRPDGKGCHLVMRDGIGEQQKQAHG